MSEQKSGRTGGSRVLLIILATVGGLALLSFLLFFSLVFILVMKSGVHAPALSSGEYIGIVNIDGVITSPEKVLDHLRQFRENGKVKAIVVRIDSPGGAVGASQEIFQEIKQTDKVKPVVASMVTTAASGAYYAAAGARYIVADSGTVTGSIGVIMKLPNVAGLLEKLGIKTTVIKSGKLKDLASITRELTPEEREVIQSVMDDIHRHFIEDVAKSRKLPVEKVKALADGRIFSGAQALKLHLVDELGNFSTAIEKAASYAKIKGKPKLLYPQKDRLTVLRQILEDSGANILLRFLSILLSDNITSVPAA